MKPVDFKLIANDDTQQLEDQVNQALKDGYNFMGEMKHIGNILLMPMVKVERIVAVQSPEAPKEQK